MAYFSRSDLEDLLATFWRCFWEIFCRETITSEVITHESPNSDGHLGDLHDDVVSSKRHPGNRSAAFISLPFSDLSRPGKCERDGSQPIINTCILRIASTDHGNLSVLVVSNFCQELATKNVRDSPNW